MNSRIVLVLPLAVIALAGCRTGGGEGRVEQDTAQKHTLTLPEPPAMMTGDSLRIDYMAAHYWAGMDVADTTWATDTAALEQAVADWTALAGLLPPHRAAELTADALRRTGCTPALQRLMYDVAAHYFCHPNSPYRDERLCLALHGAASVAETLDSATRATARHKAAVGGRNSVGSVAADFAFLTREGVTRRLSDICGRYILLLFYDPSCDDCRRTEAEIAASRHIGNMLATGEMAVVAISPDGDTEEWRSHAATMPAAWTVGCDAAHSIDRDGLYLIAATPTLYLLDSAQCVLLKDTDVREVIRLTTPPHHAPSGVCYRKLKTRTLAEAPPKPSRRLTEAPLDFQPSFSLAIRDRIRLNKSSQTSLPLLYSTFTIFVPEILHG